MYKWEHEYVIVHVYRHIYGATYMFVRMCIDMCVHMGADMFVGIGINILVDMRIDMCIGKLSSEEEKQLNLVGIRTKAKDEEFSYSCRRWGMVLCTNAQNPLP